MGVDEDDAASAPPDRAFWLLSDPNRLAILRAVWSAEDDVLTFSDIRDRVGNPNSGQFNYHLNKLAGAFLAKVDGGYELSAAGREVVRAVLAGTLTEQPELNPAPIGGGCVECGGDLVARYDGHGIIECADCGTTVMWNEFPPAGLERRSAPEFAAAFDRWTQRRFRLAMDGVCPSCAGRMSVELPEPADDPASHHRCGNCKYEARVPLYGHAVRDPAVVSFFHERDIDIASMPFWELQSLANKFETAVRAGEPWSAEIVLLAGDGRLRVVLDAELAVADVTIE